MLKPLSRGVLFSRAMWPSALGGHVTALGSEGGPSAVGLPGTPGWGRECVPGPGGVAAGGGVSPLDPAWAFQGTCLHSYRGAFYGLIHIARPPSFVSDSSAPVI